MPLKITRLRILGCGAVSELSPKTAAMSILRYRNTRDPIFKVAYSNRTTAGKKLYEETRRQCNGAAFNAVFNQRLLP